METRSIRLFFLSLGVALASQASAKDINDPNFFNGRGVLKDYVNARHGNVWVNNVNGAGDGQCVRLTAPRHEIVNGTELVNTANGYSLADCLTLNQFDQASIDLLGLAALQAARDDADSYRTQNDENEPTEAYTLDTNRGKRIYVSYRRRVENLFRLLTNVLFKEARIAYVQDLIDNLDPNHPRYQQRLARYQRIIARVQARIDNLNDVRIPNARANIDRVITRLETYKNDNNPPPGPFDIATFPNDHIAVNNPVFSWTSSENATSYDLTIASDPLCSGASIIEQHVGLTGLSQQVGPLTEGRIYACVTARNSVDAADASNNGYSAVFDITPPEAYSLLTPSGRTLDTTPMATWEVAVDAVKYSVSVATDAACTNVVQSFADVTVAQQQLTVLATGDYFLCGVAFDEYDNARAATNNGMAFEVAAPTQDKLIAFVGSELVIVDGGDVYPPFPGLVGNIESLDWVCSAMAFTAGLIASWDGLATPYMAIASDSVEAAASRLNIDRSIENTNGDLIALDAADLWDGQIENPIRYDENGNDLSGAAITDVVTGTSTFGSHGTSCSDYGNINGLATMGDLNAVNNSWISNGSQSCGTQVRVYCLQQNQ